MTGRARERAGEPGGAGDGDGGSHRGLTSTATKGDRERDHRDGAGVTGQATWELGPPLHPTVQMGRLRPEK